MIRLGVRLAVAGGREALVRLALIAVAVAIGSGLLLATLASINAFDSQNQRYAWLETGFPGGGPTTAIAADSNAAAIDPVIWLLRGDYFRGDLIGRLDVAATGPNSPVPPGIPSIPGPGQFYASPALSALLSTVPPDQLSDRFPGVQVGVMSSSALPSPDSLLIVVGRKASDLAGLNGAQAVIQISTTPPSECTGECAPIGVDANGMTLVLSVVAAALLFPVLIFVGGATRLSASRREQRFAATRLVGATPRQISWLATVESAVATVIGVAAGFGLYFASRPLLASIPFSGDRVFTADVSLSAANVLFVAVGVPLGAAIAARLALRRVVISPLGVSRRVTRAAPRVSRVIPLLAGLSWLAYLAFVSNIGESKNSMMQAYAYLLGIFTIMIGLVVAGPWLTMVGARLTSHRARRPAGLIAARRLSDNPKTAFRAISGMVLAVFVATCAIGIIATIVSYDSGSAGDPAESNATVVQLLRDDRSPRITSLPSDSMRTLSSSPGVQGVTTVRSRPVDTDCSAGCDAFGRGVVSCEALSTTPMLGRCPEGAVTAAIRLHFGGGIVSTETSMSDTTWPDAGMTDAALADLQIDAIVVGTDGSSAAVERVRTIIERSGISSEGPVTLAEQQARSSRLIDQYRQLANVVLLTSLPIAGCSLAVSVAGGLADRRRPFSLLRLTGVPLALLRRVVTLEAAVPLLISVVVAAGAGLAAAGLFLHAQLREQLQAPGGQYYSLIVGGVVVSLLIVASTLPLLAKITGPDAARND